MWGLCVVTTGVLPRASRSIKGLQMTHWNVGSVHDCCVYVVKEKICNLPVLLSLWEIAERAAGQLRDELRMWQDKLLSCFRQPVDPTSLGSHLQKYATQGRVNVLVGLHNCNSQPTRCNNHSLKIRKPGRTLCQMINHFFPVFFGPPLEASLFQLDSSLSENSGELSLSNAFWCRYDLTLLGSCASSCTFLKSCQERLFWEYAAIAGFLLISLWSQEVLHFLS